MVLELQKPRPIWQIMFSTHHTDIGLLYLIMSLAFFFIVMGYIYLPKRLGFGSKS